MKLIYAKYLQNHSSVTLTLKNVSLYEMFSSNTEFNFSYFWKYESIQRINEYIESKIATLKNNPGKLASLHSFLIKPVQRIFKYPLFLKRIYDNTEPSHIDYSSLKHAMDTFSNMLAYINEHKRRKDLVVKILGSSEEKLTDTIRRNCRKKRVQMLNNLLGYDKRKTIDEAFNQEKDGFRLVENLIKTFHENLSEYLEKLKVIPQLVDSFKCRYFLNSIQFYF